MITKAYIEEIIDAYHYRVRMPIYDQIKSSSTATPRARLPIATVCGMAGTFYNFKVDDVVYVAVEDGERDNIVILGSFLYEDSKTNPPDVEFSHAVVKDELILQGKTTDKHKKSPYVASSVPPDDTDLLWIDLAHGNVIKFYIGGEWVATGQPTS